MIEGEITYHADGEPNFYTVMKGNNWFAKIQLNGELTLAAEERFIEALRDAAIEEQMQPWL